MVHHSVDVFLCQSIQASPLRNNPSNEFVIDFNSALLIRFARITVEYMGSPERVL